MIRAWKTPHSTFVEGVAALSATSRPTSRKVGVRMFKRLFPRTVDFLKHFDLAAENALKGARAFSDLMRDYTDVEFKVQQIKAIEHEGDRITHATIDELNRTFITPIDREDIVELISRLDDILDIIDGAATRLQTYRITE